MAHLTGLQFTLAMLSVLVTVIGVTQLVYKLGAVRRQLRLDIAKLDREVGELEQKKAKRLAGESMPSRAEIAAINLQLRLKFSCHNSSCVGYGAHRCHDLNCKEHARS